MIINIPSQVNTALEILSAAGYDAYVVGGAVRDAIMGKEPDDWDIATSSSPQQNKEVFSNYKVIETGIKHGTITVIIDSLHIEITTFRIETGYSDNRHPDFVEFTDDICLDLARRDFTCNAIAYNPKVGFVDPFFGLNDIENKVIKCVGDPDKRFNEDGLRILRALRFSQSLSFNIDNITSESIHKNKGLLENISEERIFSELRKILTYCTSEFLLEYSDVIFQIIPELKAEKGCEQHHERHIYDVWNHTCVAVENSPNNEDIRLAVLLHDIGKPSCKTTDESGVDHFYGHGEAGSKIAFNILSKFKTSNKIRDKITNLIYYHDFTPDTISKKTYRKYISRFGEEFVKDLFDIRKADVSAQNPAFLESSLHQSEIGLKIFNEVISENNCFSIKDLDVSGDDLIKEGISPSAQMGKILNQLFDDVISDRLQNNKAALIKRAKELYIDGNS